MSDGLSAAQLKELKDLLLAKRKALTAEMDQNIENLAPPEVNAGSVSQDDNARLRNQTREVDAALTNLDAADIARIDRALEAMDDGSYGFCARCGCAIPFERLKIEPMTQHCVKCKSELEKEQAAARG
ncbi:TraR/DksA family transcriptional regulator [Ottowia flava]|uniref:TraR/DksA family transcriptional regulator n=1 Tax=Ottowia flava TaxID=2675430 RepID=A0ABW4KR61_9BURK|nr:TraR/DksA C4-type zinc finger protein [Ottowia sp. GY511]